jgi:uncharacterized membrane protein YqjE
MLLNAKVWWGMMVIACIAPMAHGACTYTLSPANRSHGYGAATNIVTVNAGIGCDWTVINTNEWLTLLSSSNGTSTGVVTYAVALNPITTGRTGVVTVAGLPFTITQAAAPCNFSLSPTMRNHGNGGVSAANVTVNGASNCFWTVSTTNTWITFNSATNGSSGGFFSYAVAANNIPVARTSHLAVADQTFALSQNAAACFYELSPTNRLHGFAGSTGVVSISVTPGCAWFVNNTNPWITIHVNPSGTNGGTFGYTVAPNPSSLPRNGSFSVWNESFTVYQNAAPCNYSLLPTSANPGAEAETNTVAISAANDCVWGVTNTNSWISFVGATNGVGAGSVTWVVAANAGSGSRTGVVMIADQNFTIRQAAASCNYKLSPTNRMHGYGAASNAVNLTVLSTCPWTVVNTNPWVTITTPMSGLGSASIGYSLSQNTDIGARSGVVIIGGQPFSLTQSGVGCAIDLTPATRNHGHGSASNSITVDIAPGCAWEVVNTNDWITIVGSTNGTGSNAVGYLVAANPTGLARSGYVVVNEGTVLISQNAAPCTYSLLPAGLTHTAVQETGTVSVVSLLGCDWTVVNTNNWITLLSPTNGSGSASVTYSVGIHLDPNPRSGNLVIAGQSFSVVQNGVVCSYRLSPTNRTHGSGIATNTLSVIVSNPCPWSVVNTNPWLTILAGGSGAGNGTVTYSVAQNTSSVSRVGTVVVNGATTVITQNGVPCGYSLTPGQRAHGYGAASNTFAVSTTAGCAWAVLNTNSWISLTGATNGTGAGSVDYVLTENTNVTDRIGYLAVEGQTFIVTQRAAGCYFDLTPGQRTHGHGAVSNSFLVDTAPGCAWTVVNTNTWVALTGATNGTNAGTVSYSLTENLTLSDRIAFLAVNSSTFIITQRAAGCAIDLTPSQRTHGYGANTASVDVAVAPGCAWTVVNTNAWISIQAGASGNGPGTVTYAIALNTNLAVRSGNLLIGDEVFAVSQSAFQCTYKLSPTNRTHGFGATTGSVSIVAGAGCAWTINNTNPWIVITSPTTGSGNSSFTYSVDANFGTGTRTGHILLEDQVLAISQLAPTNGFQFEVYTIGVGGDLTLRLGGGPAGIWELQGSSNMVDWVKVADLTNITGRVQYNVPPPLNQNRFFRAILP